MVVKQKNKHILKTAQALLTAAHAPRRYWTYVVVIVIYLLNRKSSRVLNLETPLEALAHRVPLPFVLMLRREYLDVLTFIFTKTSVQNLIIVLYLAFFWVTKHLRNAIGVVIPLQDVFIPQRMSLFLNLKLFFLNKILILLFRGSYQVNRKIGKTSQALII